MRIAVIREVKDNERRVALTPDGARQLRADGHEVLVEHDAGKGSGYEDEDYSCAGATIVTTAEAWRGDFVLKVKEPQPAEYEHLSAQILFAFLHLAGVERALTDALLMAGTTAIAYEGITDTQGRLPLLAPMSAVAGSMAPLVGAFYLGRPQGGRGVLPMQLFSERHGRVVVLGDGVVGTHAARAAAGLGATVLLLGEREELPSGLRDWMGSGVEYAAFTRDGIAAALPGADLLIGAVRVALGRAPHLVSAAMVASMPAGAVIVDVAIDQGGCIETSRATSHSDPVYIAHGVLHYCVSNMPGAYPRTSTQALTGATLPYVRRIAAQGFSAVRQDPLFASGVYVHRGCLTNPDVAAGFGLQDRLRSLAAIAD